MADIAETRTWLTRYRQGGGDIFLCNLLDHCLVALDQIAARHADEDAADERRRAVMGDVAESLKLASAEAKDLGLEIDATNMQMAVGAARATPASFKVGDRVLVSQAGAYPGRSGSIIQVLFEVAVDDIDHPLIYRAADLEPVTTLAQRLARDPEITTPDEAGA